jgi:quercetin dioxygenase-like cupin family protein
MARQSERHDPPGATSSSPERPAHQLAARALHFDLDQELTALRSEAPWQRGDRNGKTLVKEPHLHITLTALKAGARLDHHQTAGPVTIHALRGRLQLTVEGDNLELGPGHLLALEPGVTHAVTALEESAFLLTLGWPR